MNSEKINKILKAMIGQLCGMHGHMSTSVMETIPKAMDAYTKLINEPEVTIGLRVGAFAFTYLLHLLEENYKKGIELITFQWMRR